MELNSPSKAALNSGPPKDWVTIPLSAVTPNHLKNGIVDGPFGSNLKTLHYRTSGIPIITSGYVTEGTFKADAYLYVDQSKFKEERRSAVRPGDIVMAKIGERCGASAIFPLDHEVGILSGNALKITVDTSKYSRMYIWHYLWNLYSRGDINILKTIGAQPAISMASLKRFEIHLPPNLREQEAIAEALGDADAYIDSLEQLLEKKRALKQGAMQELLSGRRRLPGFNDEWIVTAFGDVVRTRSQRLDPRYNPGSEFCIELEHIRQGTGILLGQTTTAQSSSLKTIFKKGDVLFGKLRAYLRKFWLATQDGVCSTELWALVPKSSRLLSKFLFQVVRTSEFIEAASLAYGTHMPRSDWGVVKALEIRLPDPLEQAAISAILSDMDADIMEIDSKIEKAHEIKQGMMQQLLTGKIRLL